MWREKGEGEGELGSLDHWGNAADAQEPASSQSMGTSQLTKDNVAKSYRQLLSIVTITLAVCRFPLSRSLLY